MLHCKDTCRFAGRRLHRTGSCQPGAANLRHLRPNCDAGPAAVAQRAAESALEGRRRRLPVARRAQALDDQQVHIVLCGILDRLRRCGNDRVA